MKNDLAAKRSAALLWMAAMSKPTATQLKALHAVVVDDIAIAGAGQDGRDAALKWLAVWPGKAMFRTGEWGEPEAEGDLICATCMFDSRAAYHGATLTLGFNAQHLISSAQLVVRAAPEPLGGVINRVWGARKGLDQLPEHLSKSYGINVKKVTKLDNGVMRVDRGDGAPWVARVFPADRPPTEVKGDAAVLQFLGSRDYPAERCAGEVTTHHGQGVLITEFIKGQQPSSTLANVRQMADLLGRLHALKGGPKATKRPSGGLHLYTADPSVQGEIDMANACLEAGAFRGTDKRYELLAKGLKDADAFSALPAALTHPDFHPKNTIAGPDGLVPIDWAGAGQGPRILAFATLLFYGSLSAKGWEPKKVDAILDSYIEHVSPTAPEIDRLAEAMQLRMLIHETYSWCSGMAMQRKPASRKDWPDNDKTCVAIAEHVASRF